MTAHILIVDDSFTVRTMVRQALEGAGYRVTEAINGINALKRLEGEAPDLLLTDVNMPEMGGIELIRRVRPQQRFARLPILVLTTEAGDDLKKQGKEAGANGWLVKPFSPPQLCATVGLVLERSGAKKGVPA